MTDNLPLISIITPSYNQSAYLEATIRSVLDQDYPNLEYIIIDGVSTDNSVEIIQRYEKRLAWWVSEPDGGQAEAINKGLKRARGEIVAWLNSDDLHMPNTIQRMAAAFQETPDAGLIYGDVLSIDEDGKAFNTMRYGNWGLDDLMTFSIIGQAGTFMRRTVLEQAGYLDTRFHCMLDHHLWLRMARLAPMHYLKEVIAAARIHPDAKNVALATQFGVEAYELVDWLEKQPEYTPEMLRLSKRVLAGAHRFNGRYLLDGGEARNSLSSYLRSLRLHPSTALQEWHRMLYAFLSLFGLSRIKTIYFHLRKLIKPVRDETFL
jgi:glycosyltransferase involved in cell wall biosynthesis